MNDSSLKQKTIGALLWNLLDRMGQQVLLFIVGILVANILSVEDYALVGMLAIFSAIAGIIVDSGFSVALIQKKETTEEEFSSVFWFNLGMSCLLYAALVLCSPLIARFFHQPRLTELAAVVFLALPINALTTIQTTLLNKTIRFKPLAKINLAAMTLSGASSLIMALSGFGVWTLALQPVILAAARAVLLWVQSDWRPRRVFRLHTIRSLFSFASSLLLASLINTCFLNIYSAIIGKLYPVKQLGYYTQGNKMCDMGVSLLYGSIQNATFPIFSSIQNEHERLIRAYRKTIRFTAFITFPIMTGLLVTARPIIQLLLKEEWWPSIPFFQLLCIGGCFTILTAVNNNFIKVSGRSDGILKTEYCKVILTIAILLLTYREDVLTMVAGLVVTRMLVYLINMVYTARFTGYKFFMQFVDILPYAGLSILMALLILPFGNWIDNRFLLLSVQAVAGIALYTGIAYITGSKILKESLSLLKRPRKDNPPKNMENNTEVKVSVLMLTYNQERYIDAAIRSVMLQKTDFPFELVIGNDASTDATGRICEAWQRKYPDRIVLQNRTRNLGLQQNFIQTYAHCRGKYIAICEGDDFWTSKLKLQRQANFLDTHPDYALCFHRVINYYEDRGTKSLSNGGQKTDTDILDLARSNYISNVSVCFRNRLFGELPRWFDRVSTYDYALHLLNAQYGKIHYMRRPMAVYRQRSTAIWSEAGTDKKLDIALVIRELLMDYFKDRRTDVYDCLRQAHAQICLNLIAYFRQKNDPELINRTEERLLKYQPQWTLEDVKRMEIARSQSASPSLKGRIKRILSWGRATLSRLLPLPGI